MTASARWPKMPVQLTPEEEALREQVLLECQDWGYTGLLGWVQDQGHAVAEALSRAKDVGNSSSLDLGCGSGYHFRFVEGGTHVGIDLSAPHLQRARYRYPAFFFLLSDAYSLPFKAAAFDRVVSVYTFEHLANLPASLAEVRRVLKPDGELLVGLPAEGGLAYEIGRALTTRRYFSSRYRVSYMRLVRSEHCNTCQEVVDELSSWFEIDTIRYLPLMAPTVHLSVVIVARCTQKST